VKLFDARINYSADLVETFLPSNTSGSAEISYHAARNRGDFSRWQLICLCVQPVRAYDSSRFNRRRRRVRSLLRGSRFVAALQRFIQEGLRGQ